MVFIQKKINHKLIWLDIEHQIFNEYTVKSIEIRIFCFIKVWHFETVMDTKHKILKDQKKMGFVSYDKIGKQAGLTDKKSS
jgi:hypothetical protein